MESNTEKPKWKILIINIQFIAMLVLIAYNFYLKRENNKLQDVLHESYTRQEQCYDELMKAKQQLDSTQYFR